MAFYNIAGLTVEMESYGRTVEQAEMYRCDDCGAPDIHIQSMWEMAKVKFPEKFHGVSDDIGEYLYSGASFYKQLLNFEGLMLHSTAVVVDGKAYLFSADPGTGKSTHTSLWLDRFGDRAYILNDDKPALRRMDGKWYAFGTPWSGKHDISVNTGVPVAGIAMLRRGEDNEIEPFGGKDAILAILKQVNRPKDMEFRIKLLDLLDKLITEVPVWCLKCNMDPGAVDVSYGAMGKEKEHEN